MQGLTSCEGFPDDLALGLAFVPQPASMQAEMLQRNVPLQSLRAQDCPYCRRSRSSVGWMKPEVADISISWSCLADLVASNSSTNGKYPILGRSSSWAVLVSCLLTVRE